MAKNDCVIVRAAGHRSDDLRSEASRIARTSKVDWWVERTDKGLRFCFEDSLAKQMFASFCENLGLAHQDG